MTILFDAVSNSPYEAALSTYNWTHTVGALSFGGLAVGVAVFASGTVTGITYGGVALTLARADTNGIYRSEIWFLLNPPTGANSVVVTLSASLTSIAAAISYERCGGIGAVNGATGTGGTVAASTTTIVDNSLVLALLSVQTASGTADSGGQTNRANNAGALGTLRFSEKGLVTPPASTTLTFTGVGGLDLWAISEVEIISIVHRPFPILR